jgi:hypothetical protein
VRTGHQLPLFTVGNCKADATPLRRAGVSDILFVTKDLEKRVAGRASRERFRDVEKHDRQNEALGAKLGRNGKNTYEIEETREVLRKHARC